MGKWIAIEAVIILVIVLLSVSVMVGFLKSEGSTASRNYSVDVIIAEIDFEGNVSNVSFVGFNGHAGTPYSDRIVIFNSDRIKPIEVTSITTTTPEFTIVNTTSPLPQSIQGDSYIYITLNIGSSFAAAGYSGSISLVINEAS